MKKLLTTLSLILILQMSALAEFRVVGYFPNYSTHPEATQWTQGNYAKVPPREILQHLTHVMFFSMALEGHHPGTSKAEGAKGHLDTQNFGFYKMQDLRDAAHSAGAKIILVLGGYGISTPEFATLAASSTARNTLATEVKDYLVANDIDGVDVDWEFPNGTGGYENFRLLIEALKSKLNPLGKTVSIAINPDLMSDMSTSFLNSADFVNVMSYDLLGQDHAPLSAKDKMTALVSKGATKGNLTYGVPFYGRNQGGYGGVAEIYRTLYNSGNMANSANSTFYNGQTYYYNGPDRIATKTTWAKTNGYGGIMVWDMNQDVEFANSASLMRAIANANGTLNNNLSSLSPLSSETPLSSVAASSTPASSAQLLSSSSEDVNDPYYGSNCKGWSDGVCFNGINYDYCQNNQMSVDGVYGYKCKASQGAFCNFTEPTGANSSEWWSRVTCTYPEVSSQATSSIAASSQEVTSSSSTQQSDCTTWTDGMCFNGVDYKACATIDITVDGVNGFTCKDGQGAYCNFDSPASNSYNQWAASKTCQNIDAVIQTINPAAISQNSHFATINLEQAQTVFIVSPSGKLIFSEKLKAGSHNLKAGRFPNKILVRK